MRRATARLEAGCSIGVLTARLAERCDELLAVDFSAGRGRRARERLATCPRARGETGAAGGAARRPLRPHRLLRGPLLLGRGAARAGHGRLADALAAGGSLLAVHWRPATRDYPLLGDEVHDLLGERLGHLDHAVSHTGERTGIDRWDAA